MRTVAFRGKFFQNGVKFSSKDQYNCTRNILLLVLQKGTKTAECDINKKYIEYRLSKHDIIMSGSPLETHIHILL